MLLFSWIENRPKVTVALTSTQKKNETSEVTINDKAQQRILLHKELAIISKAAFNTLSHWLL